MIDSSRAGVARKTKVDVSKCHACHAKRRWMLPGATPATQSAAASRATNGDQAHHQTQPSATSATRATQNEGGCRQVPHLPRKLWVKDGGWARACVCVRVCARVFSYEERIVWSWLFIEFWNPSNLEMTQTTSQTTQFGTICIHFTIMFPLTAKTWT